MVIQDTEEQKWGHREPKIKQLLPRSRKRLVEKWQATQSEGQRIRKKLKGRSIKTGTEPEGQKGYPTRRRRGEPLHPLTKQRPHLNFTFTTEKPPNKEGCTTIDREIRSRLPLQKKEYTRVESSFRTQGGMWTKEATYQI